MWFPRWVVKEFHSLPSSVDDLLPWKELWRDYIFQWSLLTHHAGTSKLLVVLFLALGGCVVNAASRPPSLAFASSAGERILAGSGGGSAIPGCPGASCSTSSSHWRRSVLLLRSVPPFALVGWASVFVKERHGTAVSCTSDASSLKCVSSM